MRSGLIGLCLAALLTPAAAGAQPESLPALFQRVCMSNSDIGSDAVSQRARADGYVSPPREMMDEFRPAEFPEGEVYWQVWDGAVFMVMTGEVILDESLDIVADVCAVLSMPRSPGVERALKTIIDVGESTNMDGQIAYAYTQDADGSRRAVDMEGLEGMTAMMSGKLRIAVAQEDLDDTGSMIMLMIPRAGD